MLCKLNDVLICLQLLSDAKGKNLRLFLRR